MRTITLLLLLGLSVIGSISHVAAQHANVRIRYATFNIRYNNPGDKENSWQHRKEHVYQFIQDEKLEIIGMQEVLHDQLTDLKTNLPEYAAIGVGREDGKTTGEYAPILYRTDKFELLDSNTFWLSQHPDSIGFIGWDGACTRIATWAKFREKKSNKVFMAINTHFDHIGTEARKNSALLIIEKIKEIVGNQPAILTGDFNISDQEEAYQTITCNEFVLKDSHKTAQQSEGVNYTFHDFGRLPSDQRQIIDFIFTTPHITVHRSEIPHKSLTKGRYLSDHNPQIINIEF